MRSPPSSFYLQRLGGEIVRDRTSAAFGHRDGLLDFAILTVWRDPTETAEHVEWARESLTRWRPTPTVSTSTTGEQRALTV